VKNWIVDQGIRACAEQRAGIQCHEVFAISAGTPMTAAAPNPYGTERDMKGIAWEAQGSQMVVDLNLHGCKVVSQPAS
jgi:hypothetical protein